MAPRKKKEDKAAIQIGHEVKATTPLLGQFATGKVLLIRNGWATVRWHQREQRFDAGFVVLPEKMKIRIEALEPLV